VTTAAELSRAGATIAYLAHVVSPLDLLGDYELLVDGLIRAKRVRQEALFRHDHVKADVALEEIADLTCLVAEYAEGIALSRQRHLASGKLWPLGRPVWLCRFWRIGD
jgi:hypothetical protein